MTAGRVCAIHQPNLFPRLSTLAKLSAADVWVVLDDVQFNSRDYQHRMRLAPPSQPTAAVWLTLPVHRPRGRASLIREMTLAEPGSSARRLRHLAQQLFGRSPHWSEAADLLEVVAPLAQPGSQLVDVTEASTTAMLRALDGRDRSCVAARSPCDPAAPNGWPTWQ
ncbi:WbqC family protein [Amycolatopsis balhimycina]|uniref:WbqC family protein n=1 Tax=Amycolatopsis balhimycina TaxID=208443 RepID=UPI0021AD61D5|nr:WbqC family protein [Amycolatopsis balhimycina]